MKLTDVSGDISAPAVDRAAPLFGLPQSPGWYWSRIIAANCDAVTLQRVEWCDHQRCLVIVSRYYDPLPINRYPAGQWYGPLAPPQWPNVPDQATASAKLNQHDQ